MKIDAARVALVVALLLSFHSGFPTPAHVAFFIGIGILLAIATRRSVGAATVLVLLVGGIAIRLAVSDRTGSDVLSVTKVAIDRVLAGLDPYGYDYQSSFPPGAPFPYGPVAILAYMPFHHVAWLLELISATVVSLILAVQGRLLGLAVYAAMPIVVSTAVDGSNDTTLGLLIFLAFLVAARWPMVGGLILAVATAFKLSAFAFVPGYLAWAGLRVGLVFAAGSLVAWAPVVTTWGITSYLASVRQANDLHGTTVTWSFGVLVKGLTGARQEILEQLRYGVGAVIAFLGLRYRKTLDGVIVVVLVYLVTLYGGNWGSYAYLGGIAPLVCWRLDDWLGVERLPVAARLAGRVPLFARLRAASSRVLDRYAPGYARAD